FFTTKPFGIGSGLGLSMVYGFVKQSGGHIRIVSEVGKGTCVSFLLPRAHRIPQVDTPAQERPRSRGRGELVLLVEDNDDVRLVIRRDLLELGYNVIEARVEDEADVARIICGTLKQFDFETEHFSHGHEILRRITRKMPAICLVDLGLPDLDGLEVLRQLQESGTATIVLTGRGDVTDRVLGLE